MCAAHAKHVDEEEAQLRALARRSADIDMAERDLGLFIELHNRLYTRPEHLRDLLDALDRSMVEPVYALVEAAPQHGKTETILNACARRLRYRPLDGIAYAAYSASLALRKSRRAREMAATAGVWTGDETIVRKNKADPSTALSYWQTIDGGSFTAGGRNSGFTGDGYDKVVIDDPLKNREEAESPVFQEKAIEMVRSTFGNRIRPGGSMFITHQPWNDQDVIAQLKAENAGPDGNQWEVISLPAVIDAIYDANDNLISGMPLWPSRYSLRDLAKTKHRIGAYNWHSQYTLERRPRGDTLFRDPARYLEPRIDGSVVVISCDPGIENNVMRDSSGIVVAACYRLPSKHATAASPDFDVHMDILLAEDQWRDIPDLLDYLEMLQMTVFRGAPILLEEVSAFKALSQVARRLNNRLQIYPITPKGNKFLRAQPTADAWNQGRIRTPFEAPWVADFHREVKRFTGKQGGKDNRVDAMTQLEDYLEKLFAGLATAQSGGETAMGSSPF